MGYCSNLELKIRGGKKFAVTKQGIEQYKEGTIVSSLQAKLPIQLIAKITRTTDEKVKEVAKKHHLEDLLSEA